MNSYFAIFFCCLIFSVDFSSEISFKNFKLFNRDEEETSTRKTGFSDREPAAENAIKTETSANYIKRSDLEELANIKQRYIIKNHLDDFETRYSLRFVPKWDKIHSNKSPADQNYEIRRQRWEYILSNPMHLAVIENLKLELKIAQLDEKNFCDEIAGAYHVLSDNSYMLDKETKKDFRIITDPLKQKHIQVFMKVVSESNKPKDQNEPTVQIPKSLYEELMKRNDNDKLSKNEHQEILQRMVQRMKDKHRQIIRVGKVNGKINIKFDSKMSDLS